MLYFSFSRIAAVCFGLFFIILPFAVAQDISAEDAIPAEAESEVADEGIEPLRISVDVQEVRLDAVVLNFFGRPITNLTAEDFEVFQDGKPQKITSSVYISQAEAAKRASASGKASPYLPKSHGETLSEDDVERTILFVVDNVSPRCLSCAKMSVNRFVERQMLPNDLVGVMHTGAGNSAYNIFSFDKRQISARVNAIPPVGLWGNVWEGVADSDEPKQRIYESQLAALSYGIRALKDMPGRKIVFFMTSLPTITKEMDKFTTEIGEEAIRVIARNNERPVYLYDSYADRFGRLADDALDAGVVVHTMDTAGLNFGSNNPPLDYLNPISIRTGGLFVHDNNFFLDGIGKDAEKMISGYYLISYMPPPDTFEPDKKGNAVYHRVRVNVKGRRAESVFTRHGFWGRGRQENETESVYTRQGLWGRHESVDEQKSEEASGDIIKSLQKALFSPFQSSDLNVNIASGYVKDAKTGYFARSWIHVDPKDVRFTETEDGGARIELKTICLASDAYGVIHDARMEEYAYSIAPENMAEELASIRKNGIRFFMLLPVKRPGFYTVRIVVMDMKSGNIGSAWQLVEVPDLKNKALALSSVFMITSDEDLAWVNTDATAEQLAKGLFFPTVVKGEARTPALRTYKPGDDLRVFAALYNADSKAIARNEIEAQTVLYKDGAEYLRGEARLITKEEDAKSPNGIPILRKLTIGEGMPPGDYTLQLLVIDKKVREKEDKEKGLLSKILKAYIGDDFRDYNKGVKGIASETLIFTVQTGE